MSIKSFFKQINWQSYNIGIVEKPVVSIEDLRLNYKGIKWMDYNGYSGSWFADPFILEVAEDEIILLAEEYIKGKGRLSRLRVDRSHYKLISCEPFLELHTHLSFPIIIEENIKLYIYPENHQGGGLKIYEYDKARNSVLNPTMIIKEPLLDAQITKIGSKYFVFGIPYKTGNITDATYLKIFESDNLLGPYSVFQTIFDPNGQLRGAGQIFNIDDVIVRPVQNCKNYYGEETILKKINFVNNRFIETELTRITPKKGAKWSRCLHTFNYKDGIIAIDGLDYNHRFLGPLYDEISKFYHKIL